MPGLLHEAAEPHRSSDVASGMTSRQVLTGHQSDIMSANSKSLPGRTHAGRQATFGVADLLPGFGVVTDVNAFDQEENILGDIGGVVGKALQVARHKHQVDSLANRLGVAFHVS